MRQYPQLEFDLALLRSNADAVISRCRGMGIRVCGVIKGVDGMPEAARVLRAAGAAELGTSRLEQVAKCRAAGVPGPWLLIRIPGLTELPDVVALCETSLQSEWPTLLALEEECLRQNELVGLARQVEQRIGRKLEIVSGGATSSFTLVHWGTMPAGVNHLRIGEAILLGKDLQVDWGIRDMDYLRMDALTLRAEVVEVKDKPTYPIGEFAIDAFGRKPVYEDRGIRRRAILALGRADVGELESLIPREPGLTVIGGSSDHCIVDVEDCPRRLQVGDIVEFSLCYSHMLYATARSDMRIIFKNQSAQEE